MARVLSVTHSRQETETGCLVACAQMVLGYLGIQRSQGDLARQMHAIPHVGTVGHNILNLQSPALCVIYAQGTLELLHTWLVQEVPVIALVQTAELLYWNNVEAHHAVVTQVHGDNFAFLHRKGFAQSGRASVLDPVQNVKWWGSHKFGHPPPRQGGGLVQEEES